MNEETLLENIIEECCEGDCSEGEETGEEGEDEEEKWNLEEEIRLEEEMMTVTMDVEMKRRRTGRRPWSRTRWTLGHREKLGEHELEGVASCAWCDKPFV